MKRARARLPWPALAAALLAGLAGPAAAQPADEHGAATAIVTQLGQDAAHNHEHSAVTADALADAKDALERATRLRVAGDEAHAKAADGLALEWAETARDLVRAVDAETAAADLRRKAMDAQAQLDRSRAMVEEAIASIGRLQAELEQAAASGGARAGGHARTAVEAHDGGPGAAKKKKGATKGGGEAAPAPAATKKDPGGTP